MSAAVIFFSLEPNNGLANFLTLLAEMPWRRNKFFASDRDVADISPLSLFPFRSLPCHIKVVATLAMRTPAYRFFKMFACNNKKAQSKLGSLLKESV